MRITQAEMGDIPQLCNPFPFRCRDKEHQGICAAGTGRSSAFDCCGKGTEQIGVQMPLQ